VNELMDVEPRELGSASKRLSAAAVHSNWHGRYDVAERRGACELLFGMSTNVTQDVGDDLRRIARDTTDVDLNTFAEEALRRAHEVSDHSDLRAIELVARVSSNDDARPVVPHHRRMRSTAIEKWAGFGLTDVVDGRQRVGRAEV
jgi:hypothetical protein